VRGTFVKGGIVPVFSKVLLHCDVRDCMAWATRLAQSVRPGNASTAACSAIFTPVRQLPCVTC
jgi:hypothetical protein